MKRLMSHIHVVVLGAFFLALSYGAAQGAEAGDGPAAKASIRPSLILVSDFLLDAQAQAQGESKGLHGPLQLRKRVKDTVDHTEESPAEKAKRITDTLAQSIVAELTDKGVNSRRIARGEEPPSGTWLMEGDFVEYGEGDRVKKAVIGFGSGSASMGVRVRMSEVMDGGVRPLYDTATNGKKNRMPGAVVTKNPYVAGAKFVVAKNAPDREVKKLGKEIADKLVEYMKGQGY